jgi:hypothetical protein
MDAALDMQYAKSRWQTLSCAKFANIPFGTRHSAHHNSRNIQPCLQEHSNSGRSFSLLKPDVQTLGNFQAHPCGLRAVVSASCPQWWASFLLEPVI